MCPSVEIIRAVGKRKYPKKLNYEFEYDIGKGGGRQTYFAVYNVKSGGCSKLENGKVITDKRKYNPHTFIADRHPSKTSKGGKRFFSVMKMIRMNGRTLDEWRKKGEGVVFFF